VATLLPGQNLTLSVEDMTDSLLVQVIGGINEGVITEFDVIDDGSVRRIHFLADEGLGWYTVSTK
jgi:hypothetical protein